jgi:hypothetical protein
MIERRNAKAKIKRELKKGKERVNGETVVEMTSSPPVAVPVKGGVQRSDSSDRFSFSVKDSWPPIDDGRSISKSQRGMGSFFRLLRHRERPTDEDDLANSP